MKEYKTNYTPEQRKRYNRDKLERYYKNRKPFKFIWIAKKDNELKEYDSAKEIAYELDLTYTSVTFYKNTDRIIKGYQIYKLLREDYKKGVWNEYI